jgi:hypothetical protein
MSACQRIGVNVAAPPESLRIMLNRRQQRNFEQKAAKETKGIWGWVSVIVLRRCSGLCRHVSESASMLPRRPNRLEQCSTEGSEGNKGDQGRVSAMMIR